MCGIAGIFSKHKVDDVHLKKMSKCLNHRGPDDNDIWLHENVGFAHTRLSIIDLSSKASQPMVTADQKYALVYNGEIYNFRELRTELTGFGYKFSSSSDTEVVLVSLIHWGLDALLKFNGMFALALWNSESGELLLARDRVGIKPLYYSVVNGDISFASEQKAIWSLPTFSFNLDVCALAEYLTFQNIISDRTLQTSITNLTPGSYLIASRQGAEIRIKQSSYFDIEFSEPSVRRAEKDYRDELGYLMKSAVKRQLVSDVPVGAYLSGGIDSSAIAAIASESNNKFYTFTCGFDVLGVAIEDRDLDETNAAKQVSKFLGTEHSERNLDKNSLETVFQKLIYHLDEPRIGMSYPNYHAAQLASNKVKVVLSGVGGDELFGGYPWRYFISSKATSLEEYIKLYMSAWQRLGPLSEFKKLLAKYDVAELTSHVENTFAKNLNFLGKAPKNFEDRLNASMTFEAKTHLRGLLLVEDRVSMAHSVESRVPFLDNELLEFAMTCPASLKVSPDKLNISVNENSEGPKSRQYINRTNNGKNILRSALMDQLETSVLDGVKKGFTAPDGTWFRGDKDSFVSKILFRKNSKLASFLDEETINSIVTSHNSGQANRRLMIWSLICLQGYFGLFA